METRRFQKTKEDFICEHCGQEVRGNGYTNHCPECLWSKHVDVNPGDRANPCLGLMEPVALELESGSYVIVHRCTVCGARKRNKAADNDNTDVLTALAASAGQTRGGL